MILALAGFVCFVLLLVLLATIGALITAIGAAISGIALGIERVTSAARHQWDRRRADRSVN